MMDTGKSRRHAQRSVRRDEWANRATRILRIGALLLCASLWGGIPLVDSAAADDDCIQQGGQSVCIAPRPSAWTYDFCWNTGADTFRWRQAKCQAMGGTLPNQFADCTGYTPSTEENLALRATATATAQLQQQGCGCHIVRDTGWNFDSGGFWCYPGPAEYLGRLLVKDKRHLDYACQCPSGATLGTGSELVRSRYPPPPTCPEGSIPRTIQGVPVSVCVVKPDDMCRKEGNPILPASGTKVQTEIDGSFDGLPIERHYASRGSYHHYAAPENTVSFDSTWRDGLDYRLEPIGDSAFTVAALSLPNGAIQFFRADGSPVLSIAGIASARWQSAGAGYTVTLPDRMLSFDASGLLLQVQLLTGRRFVLRYANGTTEGELGRPAVGADGLSLPTPVPAKHLVDVISDSGRALRYERFSDGRIMQIVDMGQGQPIRYDYSASNQLIAVRNIDGTVRRYLYGEAGLVAGAPRPFALTGIVATGASGQEVRVASFGYDQAGRAVLSEHAGGIDATRLDYGTPGQAVVTDPLGSVRATVFSTAPGVSKLLSSSQPAGSGCAASTSSQGLDGNGNVERIDDFNGNRVCLAHDVGRKLEVARVEGLASGATCSSVAGPGAALPAGARKTSSAWHPDWSLEVMRAGPGTLTTKVYNGQPDPFDGNVPAQCAPAAAMLPNGQPLPLLCHQVDRATTDTTGAQGFGAAVQGNVAAREQRWTYNARGQVLTYDAPRAELPSTTRYSYYEDFIAEHAIGDLRTVTNAAGHVTLYTRYNAQGRVLELASPSGVVTRNAYDARQRLLSSTEGSQLTSYEYWPTGQLKRVVRSDAGWTRFTYDLADRLIAIEDERGNRIDYTLDAAGNRIAENMKDAGGALRRSLQRGIDALGRTQQISGRE